MISFEEEMNEVVKCKYCGQSTTYGCLIWLNGKCMCPLCYEKEKVKEHIGND